MAFWCRINQSKLKHLSNQLKTSYTQVPSFNYGYTHTKIYVADNQFWGTVRRPTDFCNNVRFFAAPFQAQQKKEEKDIAGPRLNDQIKTHFVRLVTDEGHKVVLRHEALALARQLELDLVEVQRYADPPVCKIMDYHKEKYKKEVREKDRAKAKSDNTLKKGDCKEVRFSGKIEQKDLKMKADTVQRLMERGYRVKCMALPVGKKEAEDLGGYLSRLTALIEDISVVESGPHVERKQAYVILRHVKFGPSKKGGTKKLKAVGDVSGVSKTTTWEPTIDRSGDIPSRTFSEEEPEEFVHLGVRESSEPPRFPNQRTPPLPNMNISPPVGEKRKGGTDSSVFRSPNLPNSMPRQELSHTQAPNTGGPGYGVFSKAKANAPATQESPSNSLRNPGLEGVEANQNICGLKFDGRQRPGIDNGGQRKFGIFSK